MDAILRHALILPMLACSAHAQFANIVTGHQPKAVVVFESWPTSNDNGSNGWTPTRKQLGNVGTGCTGGVITPSTAPVGQLYATTAIKTAAEAAGCAVQGVVTATSSGTGITAMNNGINSGGNDSPTAITNTYGAASSLCAADSAYAAMIGKVVHDVPMPGCHANSLTTFTQTTAIGFGNSDVLFPTSYQDTDVDAAPYFMDVIHFKPTNVSALHDLEHDVNYSTSGHDYNGWGSHWNATRKMYEACPQACSGWITEQFHPVPGGATVTTRPLVTDDLFTWVLWGHRTSARCTSASATGCYCYDYAMQYNATTGETPVLYRITDGSGNKICGIPIARPSYPKGLVTPQGQLDMTAGNATTGVTMERDLIFYALQ